MLSIGKLTPGRANYYVDQLPSGADEYYLTGEQEGTARWLGSAAGRLGLDGDVTADEFRNLLDARHPLTGEQLGVPNTTFERVAGFDLCFSAPKSVSVAWALGDPDVAAGVVAAHDRAVESVVAVMEVETIRARRGAGGHRLMETGGVAAAAFAHRSSRAGDPQIHTHVVVANLTPDADGRWTSLYGARVYRWAKTLGYLYQAELRAGLSRTLGISWGPVRNGTAEIEGIPDALCAEFSTRRAKIEAAMAAAGTTSAAGAQTATLATRPAKSTVADLATLRQEWLARAVELGLEVDLVAGLVGPSRPTGLDHQSVIPALLAADGLTANASTFDRRDVLQALASTARAGADAVELREGADQLLAHPDVVALADGDQTVRRYSTAELLAVEERLVGRAQRRLDPTVRQVSDTHLAAALDGRPTLSDEQRHMVAAITRSDASVQVVVGRAGTGKTFALDAAREAWQSAGRPVIGTALAARAAAELQAGAGVPSTTIDRLLADLERPGPLSGLAPHTVILCDEAGMVGTRKLARLLDHTLRHQASLVLIGDPRQLPEIEAGGAFAALARRAPTVELTDNRRQQHAWERHALAELRAGSVPDAVAAYINEGRITLAATAEQVRKKMVDDWWDARAGGQRVGMYALRRSDVEDLNNRARQRLQAAGLIGADQIHIAGRDYASGDQVMCLRNDRHLGVRNGTVAAITALHLDAGEVTLDSGVRLPHDYMAAGHLGHAYASTIHKAQGATVDRALLLGSNSLFREAGYVGLSRARDRSDLYLVAPPVGRNAELSVDPISQLQKDLSRSQAEDLALDHLHPERRSIELSRPELSPERQAVLADPAPWMIDALGPPPLTGSDRERWAERAARIDAYRHIYAIEGPDPLSPQPDDPTQRRAWDLARLAVLEHTRTLELDQGLHL